MPKEEVPAAPIGDKPDPNAPEETRMAYLPSLLGDEYGVSLSMARMEVMTALEITADDEPIEGLSADRLSVPLENILNKTLMVKGSGVKSYRWTVREPKTDA